MRSLGWAWLILSPILFVMGAISTVKEETTYYVQLACFSAVALAGSIGSIAVLFGQSWGRRILQVLSWIGFACFAGAALLVPVFHIFRAPEVTLASLAFVGLIAGMIGLTGLPFLYMARKLGNAQQMVPADVARAAAEPRR